MRQFWFRRLFILTIVALALSVTACGGDDSESSPDTTSLTAPEILERASARIAETDSLRFSLEIAGETYIDDAETIRLIEARGELVRPNRVHASFRVKIIGSVTVSMEIITIEAQTWATDLITGNWDTAPVEFSYNPSILFDTNSGVGPVMDRVTEPERLEDEELRDHEAFHIQATVDEETIGPLTWQALTGAPVTVDLWIDQSTFDLLRARLSESADGEGEPAVWTLDLFDHGKAFTIEPPDTSN